MRWQIDRDDTLIVELTTALMKAVYYQQLNDATAHEYIHTSYLNFYLEKYGRPDDIDLPRPLVKALLFYNIQYYRSKMACVDVLTHAASLSELALPGRAIWLLRMEIAKFSWSGRLRVCLILNPPSMSCGLNRYMKEWLWCPRISEKRRQ